ncbi:thiamine pyrophosphate-binding protein [Oceanomicrobium pacificus]|uniref:Thiamine pyrophosphate-binding protein n=1 Tax=Oceanomicrobium pacificus TaxID=2692916 RepID=A0A6B0TWW4_9RHOB|nr:thiamine pyrophosphate-binding protein [Oceanomicrobium pacificus]MXU65513.1 hypothetical protein [Oceanomicrobium pacificus]
MERGIPSLGTRLCRVLADHGVESIFGTDTSLTPAIREGIAQAGLRGFSAPCASGAAWMADGSSRLTGRPVLCLVDGAGGVAQALGAVGREDHPRWVLMSHGGPDEAPDPAKLVRAAVPALRQPGTPEAALTALERAFEALEMPRQGMQALHLQTGWLDRPVPTLPVQIDEVDFAEGMRASRRVIEAAASIWMESERPLLVIGGGCRHAAHGIRALVAVSGCAVLSSPAGRGVLADGHPLNLGACLDRPDCRKMVEAADLVVAIGTGVDLSMLADNDRRRRVIRVDRDAAAAEEGLTPGQGIDMAIQSDADWFASRLARVLSRRRNQVFWNPAELARIKARLWSGYDLQDRPWADAVRDLRGVLPYGATIFAEPHALSDALRRGLDFDRPSRFHTIPTDGHPGAAVLAAVGARLDAPEAPVLCLAREAGCGAARQAVALLEERGLSLPVVTLPDRPPERPGLAAAVDRALWSDAPRLVRLS